MKTSTAIRTEEIFLDGNELLLPVVHSWPDLDEQAVRRLPSLIVLQEAFGVNDHLRDVTRRFAQSGFRTYCPDLFYRSGYWSTFAYDQLSEAQSLAVSKLTEKEVFDDIGKVIMHAKNNSASEGGGLAVVGYCLGGRLSFLTAAWYPELITAAVIYYGGRLTEPPRSSGWAVAPIELTPQIDSAILAFFGGKDQHIALDNVERFESALNAQGIDNQVYVYADAGHGFYCDARKAFHPGAAQDAWCRTIAFLNHHTVGSERPLGQVEIGESNAQGRD